MAQVFFLHPTALRSEAQAALAVVLLHVCCCDCVATNVSCQLCHNNVLVMLPLYFFGYSMIAVMRSGNVAAALARYGLCLVRHPAPTSS